MAAPHISDLDALKTSLRQAARARRAGCDPAMGAALAAHLLADPPWGAADVVSGYWPIGDEIDIRPLLTALHEAGHTVALPVTPRIGLPLTFRAWRPGAAMIAERFGTMRPDGAEVVPDVLLVPLLAFDRRGYRLGYGGGYYDRTLAGLPGARAIGCAHAVQELDEVPAGPYDARLHAVATERGVIRCEG